MALVEAVDVWKMLGGSWVLRGVSIALEAGDVVVLEGPNGSGKTTLLKILAGLLAPTRGRVVRRCGDTCIAYVGHSPLLYRDLTVEENLRFYAGVLGAPLDPPGSGVWARLGLEAYRSRRVEELSYGWRKRADLARALLARPRVLLIDEPFTGLDSEASEALESIISEFSGSGGAVLATTPRADERYLRVAGRRLVLRDGRLVEA